MNINHLIIALTITLIPFTTNIYAQDAGDVGTSGTTWGGGTMDGVVTDGGDDSGTDWIGGCTDTWAINFNPNATYNDYSCIYTDCDAFMYSQMIQQSNPLYNCYLEAVYGQATCEQIQEMGGDLCSLVIECGFCESASGCSDNQWECTNGDCIPSSSLCDGSNEYGNASYSADCADGSD